MKPEFAPETSALWQPSARLNRLADAHHRARPGVGAERAIHYTQFHKREAKLHRSAQLKNAHALAFHLQQRSIAIHDDEWIVGSHTEHRIGAICHIEKAGLAMLEDLFRFDQRTPNPLYLAPASRWQLLRSVIPYWLNRNLAMVAFPPWQRLQFAAEQFSSTWFIVNEIGGIAHFLPDHEAIINLGTEVLRSRIKARESDPSLDRSQRNYLAAALVALEAIEHFGDRYRVEAERIGRADLAALLTRCPRHPAETLQEALQTIWLFQMIIQMESLDQGISLGRMDQYLYPLYLQEKARPGFDRSAIADLLAAFCLKLSEVIPLFSKRATTLFSGLPSGQALVIGGVDAEGNDASNELTFLLLDVMDRFKTRQPNWHARISPQSAPAYLKRVTEVITHGGGSPALYNDAVIMPALTRRGVDPAQAWNYATVGCVEPALQKQSFTSSDAALFNLAIQLELVLGGGKRLRTSRRSQRPWLDDIDSMEALFAQLAGQTQRSLDHLKTRLDAVELANARYFPTPYSSLTILGCSEQARDLSRGGAPYNASGVQAVGVADVANSLAVIEQLVFERRLCSLSQMAEACAANFEGFELLRAHALKVPKFGNDHAGTDRWAQRVTVLFDQLVSRYRNSRGGQWLPGFYSMTCHQAFGAHTAALPSGRLAGKPLADGLAPVDGSDLMGPTASLNSAAKLENERFANGINLNLKFDHDTVTGEGGRALLEALLKGYFAQGGMQMQINVLDPQVLLEAMADPQSHPNLLVRISGYSAYFADLTPEMQREIIDRVSQKVHRG